MIWLLYAKSVFLRLFKCALAYPWQAALIVVLVACGWLYVGKQDALDDLGKARQTIAHMEAASKIATAAQMALNNQVTDKQTEIAKLTDANQTNLRTVADLSSRYADRMSAQSYCRKAGATATSSVAKSSDHASDTAVVVERADFDILTNNTARLMDVKAWSDRLIAEGLAVPVGP